MLYVPPGEERLPVDLKTLHFTTREIDLKAIDWRDETFRLSWGRPLDPLVRSLEAVGLRVLPLVQSCPPKGYRIVSGRRRLRALQVLGKQICTARVAGPEEAEAGLFFCGFYENLGVRDFQVMEQALAVERLCRYLEPVVVVRKFFPLLGLPPKGEGLPRYTLLAKVSPLYWASFNQGRLFPEMLEIMVRDFPAQVDLLLILCLHFRFSLQKQKELLEGLREIGTRQMVPFEEVLRESGLPALLLREDLTPQQKGERWRQALRIRRFPVLSRTEKVFDTKVKSMGLDRRTRIKPPPFFEGGRYELTVGFSTAEELKSSLKKISDAVDAGQMDDLP